MPRKILYVSPCAERAGAEQLTKLFIMNHDRTRWNPEILFLRDGPFVRELSELGVPCHVLSEKREMRLRNPRSVWTAARKIADIVRERRIDLIHSVMGYGHLVGGIAARMASIPEVWYQHGPTGVMDYVTGLVPSRAVLVNSEYTRGRQRRYHARSDRTRIVYPPIDPAENPDRYRAAGAVLRTEWGAGPDEFVFALLGRWAPMKGQLLFIDAAERVASRFPSARFALVGGAFEGRGDEYAERVRGKIQASPARSRMFVTGYLAKPQPAVLASDCIVNASPIAEPFGLTLIEALQMGRPVIAPNRGGPLEIFRDAEEGFFFRAGSTEDLARAMMRMLESRSDSAKWERMQSAGPIRVAGRFALSHSLSVLEEEYDRACGGDA